MEEPLTPAAVQPTSLWQTLRLKRGEGVGARVTWSIRDIVVGLLLAIAAVIFLQVVFIAPAIAAGYDDEDSLVLGLALVSTLVWNGLLVLLVYRLVKRRGGDWPNIGWGPPWPNQSWTGGRIVWLIAGSLIAMWLIQGLYVGLIDALGLEDLLPDQQFPEGIFDEWWLVAILGVAVIAGAPISEELFFRGFVFGGLRRRLGFLPPALLTGSLFSVAHLQLGLIIPFSLIGMVLSLVYERTGSIWFNIALHVIFNTASFLALVLIPDARNG
jgi:membrane protease YdiL (CAAX protease family)